MKDLYEVPPDFDPIADLMDDAAASDEDFTSRLEMTARPVAQPGPDLTRLALSLAAVIRNADSMTEQVKAEEDRMARRRKVLENRSKSAHNYLLYLLETAGVDRIDARFRLTVTQNRPSVDILDATKIPDEFWREDVKVERSPNKPAILAAWESGVKVEGTAVVRKKRVIIR